MMDSSYLTILKCFWDLENTIIMIISLKFILFLLVMDTHGLACILHATTCTWACITFCCSIRRLLFSWRVSIVLISSLSLRKEKKTVPSTWHHKLMLVAIMGCFFCHNKNVLLENLSEVSLLVNQHKWHSYWEFRDWVHSCQVYPTPFVKIKVIHIV